MQLDRITVDPGVMDGVPGIRGLRFPVATISGMLAEGMDEAEILRGHPELAPADVWQAPAFAATAITERHLPLAVTHGSRSMPWMGLTATTVASGLGPRPSETASGRSTAGHFEGCAGRTAGLIPSGPARLAAVGRRGQVDGRMPEMETAMRNFSDWLSEPAS